MVRRRSARCTAMSGPTEYKFEVHLYSDMLKTEPTQGVVEIIAAEAQVDADSLDFYDGDSRLIASFDSWRYFIRKEKVLAVSVEHTD